MLIEIYSGARWIGCRVILHGIILIPVLVLVSYLARDAVLVFGLSLVVLSLYSLLAYGQTKIPLLTLDDKRLVIVNLFYKGRTELNLDEIESIAISKRKLVVEYSGRPLETNIIGLPPKEREKLLAFPRGSVGPK